MADDKSPRLLNTYRRSYVTVVESASASGSAARSPDNPIVNCKVELDRIFSLPT